LTALAIAGVTVGLIHGCGKGEGKGKKFVSIGTGSMTGVYYPTGQAVSRMLNKKEKDYGIKATVDSTSGSVYNINAVLNGDLDFGIAQSDRQFQACKGLKPWKEKKTDLRSVFSIYPESVTLLASEPSGVKDVNGLKGKRVSVGSAGSGTLQNALEVLNVFGIQKKDYTMENTEPLEAPGLVQDGRLDAFFFTVGHPNGNIKEATSGRIKMFIVPIEGDKIDKLIKANPYFAKSVIPKEFYPNSTNKNDIDTIGVKATLVTSKNVDEDVVYALTKEVFENLDEFKKLHPAYKVITKENMLKGISAPVHRGAMKYYKEAGLDKYIGPELKGGAASAK
jgi:TRAP transporter TAXI family solute receptor